MRTPLRLAMLGMIPGNGHPYSWAAIINGRYDREAMAQCPYPVIAKYLSAQPYDSIGLPDAEVTHLWTENPNEAHAVAKASRIANIAPHPEAVIGEVDAVIITTDDGTDHVRRARPFVEAGLPVFVDKPLAITKEELATFVQWQQAGARILSSSGLRYAREIEPHYDKTWGWITSTTTKSWERYGIHALEPVFCLLGPGFEEAHTISDASSTLVTLHHRSGAKVTLSVLPEHPAGSGLIQLYGRDEVATIRMTDTYHAFRGQMAAVIEWLKTGVEPYPFSHTIELMAILMAAIASRQQARPVAVADFLPKDPPALF